MKIAVVGAGICGSLTAYELIKQGHDVVVYEQDKQQTSCSYTAAGMLAPMSELESANLDVYYLGMQSLSLWPNLVNELTQLGHSIFYRDTGTLVLSHGQDKASFEQFKQTVRGKLPSDEQPNVQLIRPNELENELTGFQQGLWLKQEAQVESLQVMAALHDVIANKGQFIWQTVTEVSPHSVNSQVYDWVFDCRGLGAKNDLSLYGVRGERILLHAPDVQLNHMIRLMHPRYKLYVVPREHGHYIIGATEIESSDNGPMSVRSALELLSAAYSLHHGFAEGRIISMKTGVRPTRLDHQPVVDEQDGLTQINGLYRHGYLLSPIMVTKAINSEQFQRAHQYENSI